jgi:hypothetical protein
MTFTIEKAIPLTGRQGRDAVYPLKDMAVGDSFLVTGSAEILTNLRYAACAFGKKHSRKYSVRKVEGGHRCWRVE